MQKKRDRIIKALIRIIFWIFFGDSFALSLSAIKMLISALMNHSSASVTGPLLILAATIPTAVLFGRYYCGYICSFGAMQGLFSFAGSKLVKKENRLSQKADRYLSYLPFVVLALIIAFQILGITAMASISPFTAFGKMFIPKGEHDFSQFLTAGGIILALIIIASFFIHRPFCSYLCPMGAVYKLSSMLSARIRIPVSRRKCRSCGECCICSSHCKKERISYPALIGTIAVFVLVNLLSSYVMEKSYSSFKAPLPEDEKGPYTDGSFEGTGKGYRGNIGLIVTTENGYITDITVSASREDRAYLESVKAALIPRILESQSPDVDAISGATYTSLGFTEAVRSALSESAEGEKTEIPSEEIILPASFDMVLCTLEDGEYKGSAMGFKGELNVEVSVKNHKVEGIRLISYYDTESYLFYAAPRVFDGIVAKQSLDIDAVSGATYSFNGLVSAVADALGVDENTYSLPDARERAEKDKEQRHSVQKFIESEEQYLELTEKYKELLYGADGKKLG